VAFPLAVQKMLARWVAATETAGRGQQHVLSLLLFFALHGELGAGAFSALLYVGVAVLMVTVPHVGGSLLHRHEHGGVRQWRLRRG
jgi:hypothetical protein